MAFYFKSKCITETFDIQALKNLTSHNQRHCLNPLLYQVAGGTRGNPGFLLYWVAGGSGGNPGFLSNKSSFQLRGQCDNICLYSIFQQEDPQNVFFAERRYLRDYLGDGMLQCEKVLRTQ